VFGTEEYEALQRRVTRDEGVVADLKSRSQSDKKARQVASLERAHEVDKQLLMGMTVRASLYPLGAMMLTYFLLGMLFPGVVARLPFEAVAPFKYMTHRGLEGDDFRDASYMVFMVLANAAVKPLVGKALGVEPPKGSAPGSMWANAMGAAKGA
jgi:hypothetical protein